MYDIYINGEFYLRTIRNNLDFVLSLLIKNYPIKNKCVIKVKRVDKIKVINIKNLDKYLVKLNDEMEGDF